MLKFDFFVVSTMDSVQLQNHQSIANSTHNSTEKVKFLKSSKILVVSWKKLYFLKVATGGKFAV